jgi:hypothetical protein
MTWHEAHCAPNFVSRDISESLIIPFTMMPCITPNITPLTLKHPQNFAPGSLTVLSLILCLVTLILSNSVDMFRLTAFPLSFHVTAPHMSPNEFEGPAYHRCLVIRKLASRESSNIISSPAWRLSVGPSTVEMC